MIIIHEILKKMVSISKVQQKFITNLFTTILSMGGRINFRNLARYSSYNEKSFSRNFAKSFDYITFNCIGISRIISSEHRYAMAYDPFFIKKAGKRTYGLESFWNGSAGKSEAGLEGNGFAIVDVDKKVAYPFSVVQTPPKNEIPAILQLSEANRMDFYVACVRSHIDQLKSKNFFTNEVKHIIVDAFFSNNKFVSMVQDSRLNIVGKLRSDANLRALDFVAKTGRGRPQKYGVKVDVKDLKNFTFVANIKDKGDLYEGVFYSVSLKCKIKVACLVTKRKKKISTVLLFSTDLALNAQDIYDFYTSRFQIEFVFRDGKQFVGLSDCQARSKNKIHNHLNASISALLLTKIKETETRLDHEAKHPFSMQSHKRQNYNEMLVQRIISSLNLDPSLIKFDPRIRSVIETGVVRS